MFSLISILLFVVILEALLLMLSTVLWVIKHLGILLIGVGLIYLGMTSDIKLLYLGIILIGIGLIDLVLQVTKRT